MLVGWSSLSQSDKFERMRSVLDDCLTAAEEFVAEDSSPAHLGFILSDEVVRRVTELASINHTFRGVALTLAAYKACDMAQDVRGHKAEHDDGFSARTYDTKVTVPFLIDNSLPRNVETHWLTQTISFAPKLVNPLVLSTIPKRAGQLITSVATDIQDCVSNEAVEGIITLILKELVEDRNKDFVILTRPKGLSIERVLHLLRCHVTRGYSFGGPRLPQIAIYAMYQCISEKMGRYAGQTLDPLERMKSADRKAGTVGDIVISSSGSPVEAVEIKHERAIEIIDIKEAIDKVRAVSVTRYYLLSTEDQYISTDDIEEINSLRDTFLKQNGCELIVNGFFPTIRYYLRLLPDTDAFVFNYAALVETDADVGYEHRDSWNECCRDL